MAFNLRRVEDLLIWLAGSHCCVKGKNSVLLSPVFSQEKKDSELCGLDSELGSLEKGKLLLGKKIKQERDGNYNIQGADSRFILSEWRVLCLEFLKARVDLHYVCIVSSYDPIFVMLSTIPYTALLSPTPIFSSSSIAVLMFWPRPPMHVDAHTTLYTLHSIPYTALLGPIPICSRSSSAFLMFWPSPPMHVKDRPYLTRHSLHSSPLNLHPADSCA